MKLLRVKIRHFEAYFKLFLNDAQRPIKQSSGFVCVAGSSGQDGSCNTTTILPEAPPLDSVMLGTAFLASDFH